MHQTSATSQPAVYVTKREVVTSSRDVASYFGKEHRNVLQAIDLLIKMEPSLGLLNFQQGSFTLPATGSQAHRQFDMNRDGFMLLAMGFTGPKALAFSSPISARSTSSRPRSGPKTKAARGLLKRHPPRCRRSMLA